MDKPCRDEGEDHSSDNQKCNRSNTFIFVRLQENTDHTKSKNCGSKLTHQSPIWERSQSIQGILGILGIERLLREALGPAIPKNPGLEEAPGF